MAQVTLVFAALHLSALREPFVVATALYVVPAARVKVVEMAPFFKDTLTPFGFGAREVEEVLAEAGVSWYFTRIVGSEKVNPEALILMAPSSTLMEEVAGFSFPVAVSNTSIVNRETLAASFPHRQRAVSKGISAL